MPLALTQLSIMNTGELLYHIAIAINVVVFVISVIMLKGTRYKYIKDDSYSTFEAIAKQEWQTIKLAIWQWLMLVMLCFLPILGAMLCAFLVHFEISDKEKDKMYYTSHTNVYYKLSGIWNKTCSVFDKLYKWLLIKL